MTKPSSTITVKPEIMLLEELLDAIASGRLRVPRFQRPFVWRPDQMTDLFDSIERGYPIGSLLVWETSLQVPSLDRIADIELPPPPSGSTVSYLLDGHQRMSTLYGCLMRRPEQPASFGQQEWMWNVYYALGSHGDRANQFRHWKRPDMPPARYLPVRSVLRTMDFLAYARSLSSAVDQAGDLDALVDEAEQLAQQIKSYKMAVVRLVGGDLNHATDVYSRLNSSGQSMTPDQMVSALSYRDDGGDTLSDRIAALQEDISSARFGEIPSITIFRSILAVAGEEDVLEARWDVLAKRVEPELHETVTNTEAALWCTVDFLRQDVGVPLARLVPYNAQIMLLVAFFSTVPEPQDIQRNILTKWFWSTSWSGFFAGANTTQIKNALLEMRGFATGGKPPRLDDMVARPFPKRFDMRSARIRSFILWELLKFPERVLPTGETITAENLLARLDTNTYRHVISSGKNVSDPANRLIMPTPSGLSVRRALIDLNGELESAVTKSHGIPPQALAMLRKGDGEGFIRERAAFLAEQEREFMLDLGVRASTELRGDADIDTE